ncbi:hypothetical protein KKB83_04125 [Patescibacteria group bacterium]|nr:hypothetical protein [Patescibacteria group bacterium]
MFEIGSAVAKIKADTSDFQKGIGEISGSTSKLGSLMTKLGGVIAGAFAISKIVDFGKQASLEASNFERAMISLDIIAGKFGVSADVAKEKATELGKSLRIGVGASAESLQNLLKSGLNLDQSVELMKRFTNEAITGKSANISLAQAVQNLSFAYATGNSALGNMSGMSENWSDIIDKGRIALEKEGVATKDITDDMAKLRGTMDLTNLTLGSSERFTGTLIDKQAELGIKILDLKVKIGDILNPVLAFFVGLMATVVDGVSNFVSVLTQSSKEGGALSNVLSEMGIVWNNLIVFLEPLISLFVANVVPLLQSLWSEFMYFVNAVVPPVVSIAGFLYRSLVEIFTNLYNFWVQNWENISKILKGAWEFIVGFLQWNFGVIVGIFVVFLNLLTGNWQGAWDAIKHYSQVAWDGLKNMFNGIISFLSGWGGWLLDVLTEPFRKAWETIKGIVENIKNALDFTKRHSPSVVDIVHKGVGLVNRAFDDLKVGVEPIDTQHLSLAGAGTSNLALNISLDGAMITDEYGARSMAEKVGDLIITQLKGNVRF